jgi:muconate cycloisomerase
MATIVGIDAFPVALPLTAPMVLASETILTAENLIVRVGDGDGHWGWGESASAPTMNGELLAGMTAAVRQRIAPALIGQDSDSLPALEQRLDRAIRGNTGAKAAVAIALADLAARRRGVPFHAVLGQRRQDRIPLIAMIGSADPLAEVAHALAAGFTHFKIKVGRANVAADIALTAAVRTAIGSAAHLSADANMGWSVAQATAYLTGVADLGLAYLEQPVDDEDEAGFRALAGSCATPLCLDEGLHALRDLAAYAQHKAIGGAGLKALKFGPLSRVVAAIDLMRAHDLIPVVASKIAETSIGSAASLHLAALTHDAGWGVSLTHRYLAADVVDAPLPAAGLARVPLGPGLGVTPDLDLIQRYAAAE